MSKQEIKTEIESETPVVDLPVINVARIGRCDSLSGLSTLEFHVGYEASNPNNIQFRVWKNSGGGKFNAEWIGLASVEKALSGIPLDGTFTAAALAPIAEGKSVNTSSFIGAALLAEGLLVRSEKVARSYERGNPASWWTQLQALIAAGTNLAVTPMEKPAGHRSAGAGTGAGEGKGKASRKPKLAVALVNPVT